MRPADGDGDGVARCDIGAYEAESRSPLAIPALGPFGQVILAVGLGLLGLGLARRT